MHDKQSVDKDDKGMSVGFVLCLASLSFGILILFGIIPLCPNKLCSLFGEKSQPLLRLMIQMKVMNESWE